MISLEINHEQQTGKIKYRTAAVLADGDRDLEEQWPVGQSVLQSGRTVRGNLLRLVKEAFRPSRAAEGTRRSKAIGFHRGCDAQARYHPHRASAFLGPHVANPFLCRHRDLTHDLRKTAITNWFYQGLNIYDVMRLAGHSKYETTYRFYL